MLIFKYLNINLIMYNVLEENNDYCMETTNKKVFEFILNHNYVTPYNFSNYFKKNILYDKFTNLCLCLTKYKILDIEKEYLKKYYSKKSIKNKYKLVDIINQKNNTHFVELINILIINKRFEYLLEYLKEINISINYINYINNHLNLLYKSTTHLINHLY